MLEVVPLGGLGEFGMNMLALTWGETTIVVDAGVMFPDPELLGVDRIIPDFTYLQQKGGVSALVLTHGHEDHIGGVPHVAPLVRGPIYGTPLTLALVEPKLREHGLDDAQTLVPVRPRDRVTVGPFTIEFIRVTHSMPDCVALAIHTPIGVIVHTGDFKIDQTPIDGEHFDLHRFAQLGAEGVLALFADSTNIDRRGFTGSETEVIEAFEEIFTSAAGRLIVAAFASSIYRMQILVDLAAQFDRKVAFVGRGMIENSQIAQRLGYLRIPAGVQIRDSEVDELPRPGRPVPLHRVAGRADVGALAHRDRRSPLREDRPRRHGGPVGARDSRERKGDRPGHQPPRPPRRGRHSRGDQARPRVGARQRGRAEADAVARPAAILRAGSRRVSASSRSTRASRAGCSPAASRGPRFSWPRTATSCSSTTPARGSPARRRSAAC